MAWYLGNVRIFVIDYSEDDKNIIARLQPLQGGTVYQTWGYESPVLKLNTVVVGETDKSSLLNFITNHTMVTLSGESQNKGNYLVNTIGFKRVYTVAQTIRQDLPCDAPVYDADIELFKV